MIPFARVLCPVDFSDGSRRALDRAVTIAGWYQASLAVLYVHPLGVPVPSVAGPGVSAPVPLTGRDRGDIVQSLSEFVADHRKAGRAIDALFEEDLSVPSAIVRVAADEQADLIALGTHGRSGVNRLVLGSVANKVLKTAGCKVLIVPAGAGDAGPRALDRILCPVDLSPGAFGPLVIAASLGQKAGARLTVLHVVEAWGGAPDAAVEGSSVDRTRQFAAARTSLAAALPPAVRDSCAVDELLLVGKPYREILRIAVEQQADLIVMGTHGTSAADLAPFGSTAQHVVRQAPCPVLTVPPRRVLRES
jgi:nucleotide-binding universal stress UspA family protein